MDRRDFLKTGSVASIALLPKIPIVQEYEIREYNDKIEWRLDGELHREDGPAVEYLNGYKNGCEVWYFDGIIHRVNGPAITSSVGTKMWYQNDLLHREDGPAIEYTNGNKEWWTNGKMISSNYVVESKLLTTKIIRKIKFS